MADFVTRPEFAIHHPDDETLTVADALTRLHRDDHQRIAALVEWLAEELARKNSALYEFFWRIEHEESVRDLFEQAKKDGLL